MPVTNFGAVRGFPVALGFGARSIDEAEVQESLEQGSRCADTRSSFGTKDAIQ